MVSEYTFPAGCCQRTHNFHYCHLERGRTPESKDPYAQQCAELPKGLSTNKQKDRAKNSLEGLEWRATNSGSFDFAADS